MKSTAYQTFYFLGIGGIGMSALARYFHAKGARVAGYDLNDSPLIGELRNEGIEVTHQDDWNKLADPFRDIERALVVYTPAIPAQNKLFHYFADNRFEMRKRAVVLGDIANEGIGIAIAGTHGKTTTSSMTVHLLHHCGIRAQAFLGGIANNFNSNIVFGGAPEIVVEADEYDRSFMSLHPKYALITSTDTDHLDIYGNSGTMLASYTDFYRQAEDSGVVVHKKGLPFEGLCYAVDETADYYADNIRIERGNYVFDLTFPKETIANVKAGIPGRHNIENAVAAAALAHLAGGRPIQIAEGIGRFKGVKRRFDIVLQRDEHLVIDDYAHHPTEINAIVDAVRELHPDKKLSIFFQPHLFSRTRDLMLEFAQSLNKADALFLLDIYPAREAPIPGITSEVLLKSCTVDEKQLLQRDRAVETISRAKPELLLILGAGDIDRLVQPIVQSLEK